MVPWATLAAAALTATALLLTAVAGRAWFVTRDARGGVVTLAFALLTAQGCLASISLLAPLAGEAAAVLATSALVLEATALTGLYVAVLRPA